MVENRENSQVHVHMYIYLLCCNFKESHHHRSLRVLRFLTRIFKTINHSCERVLLPKKNVQWFRSYIFFCVLSFFCVTSRHVIYNSKVIYKPIRSILNILMFLSMSFIRLISVVLISRMKVKLKTLIKHWCTSTRPKFRSSLKNL